MDATSHQGSDITDLQGWPATPSFRRYTQFPAGKPTSLTTCSAAAPQHGMRRRSWSHLGRITMFTSESAAGIGRLSATTNPWALARRGVQLLIFFTWSSCTVLGLAITCHLGASSGTPTLPKRQ